MTPDPIHAPADLPRILGFWRASGIMVGIIIGSGIFATPAVIAGHLGNPWLILGLWALGGVISLAGALTYAELAAMHPHSGGVYVFLREGFGRVTAFVFGWTYFLLTKPVAAAAIPMVFADHINLLLGTQWDPRLITIATLVLLTALNVRGTGISGSFALLLTILKFGALLAIIVAGLALLPGSGRTLAQAADAGASPDTTRQLVFAIVAVMTSVLWTYDGWSDVGAVAGEVKDPRRNLPMVYAVGTLAITAVYVVINAVYMLAVPLAEMRVIADAAGDAGARTTIAPTVVHRLLAGAGVAQAASLAATLVTVMILISTLGSTHGSIITGARVTYAQSRDGLLFRFFGLVHPRFGTPHVSLWIQCALSCLACWSLQTFEALARTFVFTMWIFYGLAGAAIFVLRARRPDADRPFRCPGYPLVPAVFILASLAMTLFLILDDPWGTLPWLLVLVAGIPVYFVWVRIVGRANNPA